MINFSIIVTIYNIESYIEECLNSILNQEYENYEVILVDDGSTDNSGLICSEIAKKYRKLKYFFKENGGLSSARNYGIKKSIGDYIIFIDGDDFIERNCLNIFAKKLHESRSDVLITTLIEYYSNQKISIKDRGFEDYFLKDLNKDRVVRWICNCSDNTWPAPKYIVSRDFIEKNNLQFLEGRLHEDLDWTSRICYLAESFAFCSIPWYNHRMNRTGSITSTFNVKRIIDVIEMASLHYRYYSENKNSLSKTVYSRIMSSVYPMIMYVKFCNKNEKEKVIRCIKDNLNIFCVYPKLKYKFFTFMLNKFGVDFVINIIR